MTDIATKSHVASPQALARAVFVEGRTTGDELWDLLGQLQATDPLYHFADADIWVATGNSQVRAIMRSPAAEVAFAERNDRMSPGWRDHHSRTNMAEWFGHIDGPRHRHIRGAVNPHFLPALAQAGEAHLRPSVRDVVAAFKAKGGGNFLLDVGYKVTARVTDYLLGLEGSDHPDFHDQIEKIMKTFDFGLTADQWQAADQAANALRTFWRERIRERMARPAGDDVLARLIRADLFDEHQMIVLAENILAAGSDTTAHSTANGLHLLLSNSDQLELARASPGALAALPDEIMRLASAAPSSGRGAAKDLEIDGRTIPAGSVIIAILGAANRDPAVFDDPHRMNLLRDPSARAVPFGIGPHICLGQWFARSVIRMIFEELLGQCATIAFDGDPPQPNGIGIRQLPELNVVVS